MSARPARGLRHEAPLLLAGALLVFVALAGFTLLAWRSGVARLSAERESEALAIADRLAREAERRGTGRLDELAARVPPGAAVALFGARGEPLDALGHAEPPVLEPAVLGSAARPAPVVFGPGAGDRPAVVAIAPYAAGGETRYLRVELPAATLAAERRTLAVLGPVAIGLSLAAALVVLLYVRALARPYETLLARAREAGAQIEGEDELAGLVATFDRALAAMAEGPAGLDRLRAAFGSELDGGFLLLDREGALLAATPAAAELLAIAPPELGAPVERALAGRPELAALLAETVRGGRALPRGVARVEREGGDATLGVTAEPLRGPGGRARGWLVVVADLTELERRAAHDRLADGLAQLGELSAGVAHELRNSLATLTGWVTLARRRPQDPDTAEALGEIARETGQLARVVEDFLAFARPGTRRLDRLDLSAVVARAAQDPGLEDLGVALERPAEAPATGDAELLERALRNLFANAAAAQREAGIGAPLEAALAARGAEWEISIADRGAGVPAALRERLFEPFVSGRAGGAGLGLALARRIAVLHGGSLALEDRTGGGTVARLLLPRGDSVPEGNNCPPGGGPGSNPGSTS
jgi:signal transduction histidine kinase